jgi:hypothetical protein
MSRSGSTRTASARGSLRGPITRSWRSAPGTSSEWRLPVRRSRESFNDKLRVAHSLEHPVSGHIGFWSKCDSVSAFKNLRVSTTAPQ